MKKVLNVSGLLDIDHGHVYKDPLYILTKLPGVASITALSNNRYKLDLEPIDLGNGFIFDPVCIVKADILDRGIVRWTHDIDTKDDACTGHITIVCKPIFPEHKTFITYNVFAEDFVCSMKQYFDAQPSIDSVSAGVFTQLNANCLDANYINAIATE